MVLRASSRSKILGACAGLLLALGSGETWFRFVQPTDWRKPLPSHAVSNWTAVVHRPSSVPGLLYELNPGADCVSKGMHVAVNALGLRGPETTREKVPGSLRIAAIGDSVTFGFNVASAEAWPAVLERELAARLARPVEVLNFGVGGYSALDSAAVLREKAMSFEPDLVVYGYFLNDPEVEPLQPLQMFFAPVAWWQHSALLRRVSKYRYHRLPGQLGAADFYDAFHALDGPWWPNVLAALDQMRAAVRPNNVPLLVAVFPTFQGRASWADYPWSKAHANVVHAARERGLRTFDVLEAFRASGLPPGPLASDDDHPSVAGHALAARALADWIASELPSTL